MTADLRVFPTRDALGDALAELLLHRAADARLAQRRFLLGMPTGRTPLPILAAMAERVARHPQDLSRVVLVMMDEYLVPANGALRYASPDLPWSCHSFAREQIAGRLNAHLPREFAIDERSIWFPDPEEPDAYDPRIANAGGVDFFLLASGASDGHVAFNAPGSPRDSRTRIVALSESTRADNLQTFPAFGTLDAVPRHGVSVGVATITDALEAVMVVWGEGKRHTLQRMLGAAHYDLAWPATLIHECRHGEIIADREAAMDIVTGLPE